MTALPSMDRTFDAPPRGRGAELVRVIALFVVAAVALWLRHRLALTLNANWDEYNFLRFVHENARGALREGPQTFHAHLFAPLLRIDGLELDQVLAGRQVMFAVQVVAALALWRIGARLLSSSAGLFAVVATSSFSFVLQHGASFRYDPLLSGLFLVAAWLLVGRPRGGLAAAGRVLAAGGLFGLALVISVKAAFFGPSLALMALVRLDDVDGARGGAPWSPRRAFDLRELRALRDLRALGGLVVSSGIVAGALSLAHRASLASGGPAPVRWASAAARSMIAPEGKLFPRREQILPSLTFDTAVWTLLAVGLVLVVVRLLTARGRARRAAVLVFAFALPMASIVIYRNAWPYYFATVLPGAALLCGAVVAAVEGALVRRPLMAILTVAALTAPLAVTLQQWVRHNGEEQNHVQRALLTGVHEIFPAPVPYLDRCGMVSSFPKVGPFMSTWGMELARAAGARVVPELLATTPPVFILANVESLELDKPWRRRDKRRLVAEDFRLLRSTYVHHWGAVWVAGVHIDGVHLAGAPAAPVEVQIVVPGPYTVEATGPVTIDGATHAAGSVVTLVTGAHRVGVEGAGSPGGVTLRWGDHLRRPTAPLPEGKIFTGFEFAR